MQQLRDQITNTNLKTTILIIPMLFASQAYGFEQADIDRFADTNECQQCDLYGAELRNLFLAKLSGANLFGTNLVETDLVGANLWRAQLAKANLWRAKMSRVDLREAYLVGASDGS